MESIPSTVKACSGCGEHKPASAFFKNPASSDGLRTTCRVCQVAATFESRRKKKWFDRYGITPDDYQSMLESQGGVCAICSCPETGRSNSGRVRLLAVDHCHKTGKVRGLLCGRCNFTVGVLENAARREQVESYLRRYTGV